MSAPKTTEYSQRATTNLQSSDKTNTATATSSCFHIACTIHCFVFHCLGGHVLNLSTILVIQPFGDDRICTKKTKKNGQGNSNGTATEQQQQTATDGEAGCHARWRQGPRDTGFVHSWPRAAGSPRLKRNEVPYRYSVILYAS